MSHMFSSINGKNQQIKQYDCDNSILGPPAYRQNFSCYILSNIKGWGGKRKKAFLGCKQLEICHAKLSLYCMNLHFSMHNNI